MKKYIVFAGSTLFFIFSFLSQNIPVSYAIPVPVCNPPPGTTRNTAGLGEKCNYHSITCNYQIECSAGLTCDTHLYPDSLCVSTKAKAVNCSCNHPGADATKTPGVNRFTCNGQQFYCSTSNLSCYASNNNIVTASIVDSKERSNFNNQFPPQQYTVKGVICKPYQHKAICSCTTPNKAGGGNNEFKCNDTSGKSIGVGSCGSVHDACSDTPGVSIDGNLINPNPNPSGNIGTGWNVTGIACHGLVAKCTCTHNNGSGSGQNGFSCTNPDTSSKLKTGGGYCNGTQYACQNAPGFSVDTSTTSNYSGFLAANGGYSIEGIKCTASTPSAPTPLPPPPSPPCQNWSNGECTTFTSAFGPIATNPSGFVKSIFGILLSISGGIALLLIIKAGYQLMTSQGKPEQIQQGRDQLIAAIVGLIFLIFSFVFLQLIGFDILHIYGFGA